MIRFVAPVAPVRRPAVITTRAPLSRPAKSFAARRAESMKIDCAIPQRVLALRGLGVALDLHERRR